MVLLQIIVTALMGFLFYIHYPFVYYYQYLKKIPSPRFWPIIGHGLMFINPNLIFEEIEYFMKKLKSKSLLVHVPTHTFVMTKDYKLIEHILGSPTLVDKGYEYRFLKNWMGDSVILAGSHDWHQKRTFLSPAFNFQILERFQDTFNRNAAIMISALRGHPDKECVDVSPVFTNCTLDNICETVMGISVNAQSGTTSSPFAKAVHKVKEILTTRIFNPLYHNNFLYNMSFPRREERRNLKFIHDFQDNLIRTRRETLSKNISDNLIVDGLGRKKKIPFLDLLLQTTEDGQVLTNKQISNEVSTFITAGHDTVSSAACFAIYLLSKHPEVQQKVVDELKEIFGDDKDKPATLADIQSMTYLKLVIKETLRLYPSGPIISRKNYKEFTIDGITYPIGIYISIFIYGLHRDADIFEDPDKFDPERFSEARYDGKKRFAYIPFSAGPRNCIGQKFAMFELKTIISSILRNFIVKPTVPRHIPVVWPNIVLQSSNGIKVSLLEREYY